jgi:hypothetical protein
MLGDGGLAHLEWRGQILDRCLALGETGEDRPPGGIGQGGERRAQLILLRVQYLSVI